MSTMSLYHLGMLQVLFLLLGAAAQQAPAPGTQFTLSTGEQVYTGQKVMAYFLSDSGKSTEPDLAEIVSSAGSEVIIKFVSDGVQQSVAESWIDLSKQLSDPIPGIQSAPAGGGGGEAFVKVIVKKLGHTVLALVPGLANAALSAATTLCTTASQNTPLDFILGFFSIFFSAILVNRISEGNPPKAAVAQKSSGTTAQKSGETSFFSHLVFLLLFAVYVLLVMDFTKGGMNLVSPVVQATGQDPETCAVIIGGGATLIAVILLQFGGGSSGGSGGATAAAPSAPSKSRFWLWISAFVCVVLIIADIVQLYGFEGKPLKPLQDMLIRTSNVDMNAKELSTLLGVIPGVLLLRTLAEFAMGPPGGSLVGGACSFLAWEATLTKQADGESWGLRVCDAGTVSPAGLKVEALSAENTAAGRFNASIPSSGALEETAIRIADRVIGADGQAGPDPILGRLKAGNASVHLFMIRGQPAAPAPGAAADPAFKLEVTLEKAKQGESLGLKLNEVPETGQLRIDEVREGDSPATRYNSSLPPGDTKALQAGDIVFSAGSVTGPTNKVLDVLRAQQKVNLVLIRPGVKMNTRPKLTLQRSSPEDAVGLVLRGSSDGSGALEVAGILPTSMIPNGAICTGDQITSINGKKDMASMAVELACQPNLELEVRTWGDAGPAQPGPISRAVTAPASAAGGFGVTPPMMKPPEPAKPTPSTAAPGAGAAALAQFAQQLAATESFQQQMLAEITAQLHPHQQRLAQLQGHVHQIGAAQGKSALDLVEKNKALLDLLCRQQVEDGMDETPNSSPAA